MTVEWEAIAKEKVQLLESGIDVSDMVGLITQSLAKKQNDIFAKAVYENAKPKIKGEVTKGKMKCRGIRIMQRGDKSWVSQRGVCISPVFDTKVETELIIGIPQILK